MDENKLLKKFADLDPNWKDAVTGMDENAIKTALLEVAKSEFDNQHAKDEDEDLASCKMAFDSAKEHYVTSSKENNLKTKFLLWTLKSRTEA